MSQFYASIQGNRGMATRMGSKESGISGHIRGWNIGVKAECFVDDEGNDCVYVSISGGSNGRFDSKPIGTFMRDKKGRIRKVK